MMDSTAFIKFIGHQHSSLVETTDHISFCYAFLVFCCVDLIQSFFGIDVIMAKFFANQMIFNTAFVFERTVFLLYTINQYIIHQNGALAEQLITHFGWVLFRVINILIAIHFASIVTQEVKCIRRSFIK